LRTVHDVLVTAQDGTIFVKAESRAKVARRELLAVALTLGITLTAPSVAQAAAGDLDRTFSRNGVGSLHRLPPTLSAPILTAWHGARYPRRRPAS
jgi:hypothetical protein